MRAAPATRPLSSSSTRAPPPGRGRAPPRVQAAYQNGTGPPQQPGDRLLPLLRGPGDLLALGPRVAIGALNSLPQLVEAM